MPPALLVNAFTVDVEDYYHVTGFADRIEPTTWEHYPSRVVASTHRILNLLERHQVHGTFFILGWVANRHPELVRDIQKAGHEIGGHSYWHRLIYNLTPDEFRADLQLSHDVISQITGDPVRLHRAPSFSITQKSLWALDILVEEGIEIDSSIFPVHHDRYGLPDAEPRPHRLETASGSLWEFPPSVYQIGNYRLPVGGGGYFRLYPYQFTRHCLQATGRRHQSPFMFYIHPWEVDPDQPRMVGPWLTRLRHYVNLGKTERKLDRLLSDFPFDAISRALEPVPSQSADSAEPPHFHSPIRPLPVAVPTRR